MKKLIFSYLAIIIHLTSLSQDQQVIDSLLQVLEGNITDQEKIDTYVEIAKEYMLSDSLKTVTYGNKAIELANKIDDESSKANALYCIGIAVSRKGYQKKAIELFHQVLKLSEENNYLEGKGRAYNGLNATYLELSDFAKALVYGLKALNISQELGNKRAISASYNNIGNIYDSKGDYVNALKHRLKALEFRTSLYKEDLAIYINNTGFTYKSLGNYPKALAYHFEALEIRKELNIQVSIALCLINIGSVYEEQADYVKALDYYTQALEIREKMNDRLYLSESHRSIGRIYETQGQFNEALAYYTQALTLEKELNNKKKIAKSYVRIGAIHFEKKNYSEALSYQSDAFAVMDKIGAEADKFYPLFEMSKIYLALDEPFQAHKYLLESKRIAQESKQPMKLREAYEKLALIEETLGNYQEAYKYHVRFKQMSDSLNSEETTKQITRLEAEYEFEQEKDSIQFINASERLVLEKDIERRKTNQKATFIGLGLSSILLAVLFLFYESNKKSNHRLATLNNEIQIQNIEIKSQRDHLEDTLEELKVTQAELVKKEKLASLGVLVAGVSHEINNPLNYILKSIEIANRKIGIDKNLLPIMKNITTIQNGAFHIKGIVEKLRKYSYRNVERGPCDINKLLTNCSEIIATDVVHESQIIKKFQKDLPPFYGNQGELHQAFLNILRNAGQAIHEDGSITISTRTSDQVIIIEVKDTGTGISTENLSKLGDPFFTTKEPDKGTGLGLFITFDILANHGIKYLIESEEGKGTLFKLIVPINPLPNEKHFIR